MVDENKTLSIALHFYQGAEKNAYVCFARMSFVTPHIFLGLASFHFLVISDRFISKHRRGIPSTLEREIYMRECRQRMQLTIMVAKGNAQRSFM